MLSHAAWGESSLKFEDWAKKLKILINIVPGEGIFQKFYLSAQIPNNFSSAGAQYFTFQKREALRDNMRLISGRAVLKATLT